MFYLFLFVTPLLVAQEETATVVFYRTHNKFYRAGKPIVRCDGAPIGRIGNGLGGRLRFQLGDGS